MSISAKETIPKCSKCGRPASLYRELATTAIRFDLNNSKFDEAHQYKGNRINEGQICRPGNLDKKTSGFFYHTGEKTIVIESEMEQPERSGKVEAECSRGHIWVLRNHTKIDTLISLHGFNKANEN